MARLHGGAAPRSCAPFGLETFEMLDVGEKHYEREHGDQVVADHTNHVIPLFSSTRSFVKDVLGDRKHSDKENQDVGGYMATYM